MPTSTKAPVAASVSEDQLRLLIHHVFLTPGHPQNGDDLKLAAATDDALLELVCDALRFFTPRITSDAAKTVVQVGEAITFLRHSRNSSGNLDQHKLEQAFSTLSKLGGNFPIHVSAQNAAIIANRRQDIVIFEFSELAPRNEAAMSTPGRLKRHFPGSAVAIPLEVFDDSDLHSALADAIARMGIQEVASMKATASKAGHDQIENRDTTDPAIVTDFLATFLSALGRVVKVPVLEKNTREQVSWRKAKLPWRRSAVWLLCRVTIQSLLSRLGQPHIYKQFMVFLMALILEAAVFFKMPSEVLYCMVAKISGRLKKLGPKAYDCLQGGVGEILARAVSCMEKSWQAAAQTSNPNLMMFAIPSDWYQQDQHFAYPDLDTFIQSIDSRKSYVANHKFSPSWQMPVYSGSELPNISIAIYAERVIFDLLEFEQWVTTSLDSWLTTNIGKEETPGQILRAMKAYHTAASDRYKNNPEATSLMILIVLELWIACDKSACEQHKLLHHFNPEVSRENLQSLILPAKRDTERLHLIEVYIKSRRKRAEIYCNASIFSSFGTKECFAVQFFATSNEQQFLKQTIEQEANKKRDKKRTEFRAAKEKYESYIQESTELDHEFLDRVNRKGYKYQVHNRDCSRCDIERKAAAMKIEIHEWPLPSATYAAENVVFELRVPVAFSDWRDATAYIISSVFKFTKIASTNGPEEDKLSEYLRDKYVTYTNYRRFVLISTTKSNKRTHRKIQAVSTASEADILLANGLQFHYYDTSLSSWANSFRESGTVAENCTYKLSPPCSSLQKFLHRPHQSPNGEKPNCIISRQSECPEHMSLEEFKAMASLACGYRVQWLNVLTQLHMPTVDFANYDVLRILQQISGQVGPPAAGSYRAGHRLLEDETFALACVEGLEASLSKIADNWESYYAVSGFVTLAAKLLSFSVTEQASAKCLQFLRRCRIVAQVWMSLLQEKVKKSETESTRGDFLQSTLQVARICIASFNVDEQHVQSILESVSDAAILIEASITAHDASCSVGAQDATSVHKCAKALFKSFRILKREITANGNACLDIALQRSWAAYPGGATWETAPHPHENWMHTSIVTIETKLPLRVNYDILTGELLVNGSPLSRLPGEYEKQSLYAALFGKMTLEVLPTDMPGMKLSSKKLFHGYALFFGMSEIAPHDLLLVAKSGLRVYDVVPSRVFGRFLPDQFVNGYIHWYDRHSQTIEFRDKDKPWKSSPDLNWTMRRTERGWTLERQSQYILLGPETSTARHLARLLKPLEEKAHIHITLHRDSKNITVEMPRLQTDFLMDAGSHKLFSRQFRGMYVDYSQSIATLVGLQSKLVLRNDHKRRKALIPDGEPTWSWDSKTDHTRVSVPHGTSKKVHAYDIDTLLQRLVDNGSLQSKLVVCHLHALTSHCLPDELTGRTGTEQALSILRSASLRSFEYLQEKDAMKLTKIARLTPARQYYPRNLRSMETVDWDQQLSFLSQDNAFHALVEEIFAQARSTKLFYPDACELPQPLNHVQPELKNRQTIRAASFQVYGFGAENHTSRHDAVYESRDTTQHSNLSKRSYQITQMLTRNSKSLIDSVAPRLVDDMWLWLSCDRVQGSIGQLSTRDICYGSQWLGDQKALLRQFWCQLHHLLVTPSSPLNRFQVMLCLGTLGYSTSASLQPLQALAAFFSMPNVFNVSIPSKDQYLLSSGRTLRRPDIEGAAEQALVDFKDSPEFCLAALEDEDEDAYLERRRTSFEEKQIKARENFVESVCSQWICEVPVAHLDGVSYLNCYLAMDSFRTRWENWYRNHCFYEYLIDVAAKLKSCPVAAGAPFTARKPQPRPKPSPKAKPVISDQSMFESSIPSVPSLRSTELNLCKSRIAPASSAHRLAALLERIRETGSSEHPSQRQYADELERSLEALKDLESPQSLTEDTGELAGALEDHLRSCQDNAVELHAALLATITNGLMQGLYERPPDGVADGWQIAAAFMAPRTSSSILLSNMVRTRWDSLSWEWKMALVAFGTALTGLQRAERLIQAKTPSDLVKELGNLGHTNWEPMDNPESLLLEIESGILIREVQDDIASEMKNPENGKNSVMQLNMGEGKSSVIVPAVAAYLADGSSLVRVVVGKPQAKELFRTLVSKLSGLLNRRVFHMPFNRSLRLNKAQVKGLYSLYKECMEQGGILLVQPEHMLSFKLMAIEYQFLGNHKDAGTALVDLYHFFQANSRDIVDESDENFSPKFELIYTMKEQRPIELSPDRWTVLQRILDVVTFVAPQVQKEMPEGIELTHQSRGRFPRTRILRDDAGTLLLHKVTQHICDTGLPGIPIGRQSDKMRQAIFEYIIEENVSADQITGVESNASFFTDIIKGPLLLLRGLISGRVLLFALRQKRWRVNYGLDVNREPPTKLAVPYRAKDSPSTRAEFSHPDVVILLTCLSYYYEGLSEDSLIVALTHLMRSDQAETEYNEWVADAPELPASFHRLAGINIKDLEQVTKEVFPHLRHAKSVIDYFLSHLVFPKEMKEFSHKLSSSGWDLGAQKEHATTGFSGTNDSRHVLPLEVKQLDIQEQLHTNALVLENLLRPENIVQLLHSSDRGYHSDTERLLEFVAATSNRVHVVLDVGAQVLELTNIQLAARWLELLPLDQKQEAVVFSTTTMKSASSIAREQKKDCRLHHLKLPEYYRAAVTLGPDLTKDRLVQACMRMRKLGHGQAVIFCVTKEMQSRICMATGKAQDSDIGVDDVLMWAISETHTDLRRLMPLWAIQGARFEKQQSIWNSASSSSGIHLTPEHAESFLEEEAQTIEYRYRPTTDTTDGDELVSSLEQLNIGRHSTSLAAIQKRCEEFGVSQFRSAALQEEQEKELAPEIEQQRHVERPHSVQPAEHELHPHLKSFITTGSIPSNSPAFQSAFLALLHTSVGDWVDLGQFPNDLRVTVDYTRTVQLADSAHIAQQAAPRKKNALADSFQRPVQWILTAKGLFGGTKAVIISPFEAQELIPQLTMPSSQAHLHVYAPRTSRTSQPLDLLRLYSIPKCAEDWELPRHLRLQLNLFAGQLYFGCYQDYADTCEMLDLAWRPSSGDDAGVAVETDGFVAGGKSNFTKSPAQAIKVLLTTLRRDCQEIDKTHWGRILGGEFLTAADFEI
ncbi:hypothetical protein LMH87_007266 [Akanthomyces muscarius]|uniref:ubiquitinyl hydrolase 1 n=1 Tax=Akanthomyces muscarius TaxID=2231603 RepID=A0A9W8QSK2_AKAMU|nr:hypothetical protein LMH87_007266 [Akanthomyces muscarius]KAJ4165642.1 hypothetical protein LMH87_007266 [Akanthomyces muscarius]